MLVLMVDMLVLVSGLDVRVVDEELLKVIVREFEVMSLSFDLVEEEE